MEAASGLRWEDLEYYDYSILGMRGCSDPSRRTQGESTAVKGLYYDMV